jgi:S1-C subfamily serine protease
MLLLPALLLGAAPLLAQSADKPSLTLDDISSAVVEVHVEVPNSARTAAYLGTRRDGTGVVIDEKGLVLSIGYLILEGQRAWVRPKSGTEIPAAIVGYDADTGFGLLRMQTPLGVKPVLLGNSAALKVQDPVLVVYRVGDEAVQPAVVVSRRTFTGYWEYLLNKAIFTAPASRNFAGAALIDRNFALVGIGSLFLQNVVDDPQSPPGNLFVPIDLLKPILAQLVATGHTAAPPRPWLGINVTEQFGRVIVIRVTSNGPASIGGLQVGDIILEVGGKKVDGLESFYHELWNQGSAGVTVTLVLLKRNEIVRVALVSDDRSKHYRTQME